MALEATGNNLSKEALIAQVQETVDQNDYTIVDTDLGRPWGGFYRLDNGDAERFAAQYFPEVEFETFEGLSPKFLLVAPGEQLSWQLHNRRAELWRVLEGPVGVKLSNTDEQPSEVRTLQPGESIQFDTEVRHRLIGLTGIWGLVAEIWQHTDPANPSDEDDIIRLEDNYGR
ncbi:phosphoheptose isomerase [Candidatus Saccharibacteria bacterium]|nr:MAG: phosphoheptose isomerase [Candidatus Saccharibacteria bacterium]